MTVVLLLCLSPVAAGDVQEDRQKAIDLWDAPSLQREAAHGWPAFRSFAVRERTDFNRILLRDIARGKVDQIVCQLPNDWWEFLDYRPGKMGYSVRVFKHTNRSGRASHGGPTRPFLRPDTNTAYRLRQLQYVYFLETRWVQPTPIRVSSDRLGWKSVDRLETLIDDDMVVFYIDVRTHLPRRIETVRKIAAKPPRPGVKGTGEMKYTFQLEGYHEVAGIQVPALVKLGGDPVESHVEINPDYDPLNFDHPPHRRTPRSIHGGGARSRRL